MLDRAIEIVNVLNGIAKLEVENWENIRVAGVAREEPNGTRTQILFAESIRSRSRMGGNLTITRADGGVETTTDNILEAFADLASRDINVSRALRLFGSRTPTWVSLYKVYEIIETEVDSGGLANRSWASKNRIRSFKQTANSVSAAGDEARHGSEPNEPPRSPMSLAEAESLISGLLKNWLRSKQK